MQAVGNLISARRCFLHGQSRLYCIKHERHVHEARTAAQPQARRREPAAKEELMNVLRTDEGRHIAPQRGDGAWPANLPLAIQAGESTKTKAEGT